VSVFVTIVGWLCQVSVVAKTVQAEEGLDAGLVGSGGTIDGHGHEGNAKRT